MRLPIFRISIIAIVIVNIFSCAGNIPPAGGPTDTVPPEIVETSPQPGTLRFDGNSITIRFSEYVDRRTVEESIFFSPRINRMEFDWSGEEVTIQFEDTLRPQTTYIMTVGTDVTDTRNRNKMAQSFALPFSTGDVIDSGAIGGTIYDENPEGVMLFAYRLDDIVSDTLNPAHTPPSYLTQAGKGGSFILPYLSIGRYRLIAVRDEYKNGLYDVQTDAYGVGQFDVNLTAGNSKVDGLQFRMAVEDTTPPFLSSARPVDRNHVLLRFSEPVDTSAISGEMVHIIDTLSMESLEVVNISITDSAMLEAQVVTGDQTGEKGYRVMAKDFRDRSGNRISGSGAVADFTSNGEPDTSLPMLSSNIVADSVRNISPTTFVTLRFSEAVDSTHASAGITLVDSSLQTPMGEWKWRQSTEYQFIPTEPFAPRNWYTLKVVMDSIIDFSGNRYHDSLWVRRFQITDELPEGSIAGRVTDDQPNAAGRIILNLSGQPYSLENAPVAILQSPGPFEMNGIEEGRFTIDGFRDADGNGKYSPGRPFPFQQSERFIVGQDTLKVRARWPLEGVVVRFK